MPSLTESKQAIIQPREKKNSQFKINNSKTTWINNTTNTFKFRIFKFEQDVVSRAEDGTIVGQGKGMDYDVITLEPGATVELPSRYDNAIRRVDRGNGSIVGGLCPYLSVLGEENPPPFSDALDYVKQDERIAREKLIKEAEDKAKYLAALEVLKKSEKVK